MLRRVGDPFGSRYSDAERAVVRSAYLDRGWTAKTVVSRAAAGELEHDDEPLPAFEVPESTVRSSIDTPVSVGQ
jgi:hypothetical protein